MPALGLHRTTIHISRLRAYPGNPRRGDVATIAASLEKNGQYRPIVVNRRSMAQIDAALAPVRSEPPLPERPRTRHGDLCELGEHRLACADARSPESYERLLDGEAAELLWTDPPYGMSYVVIDSPPLATVVDALPLARAVDDILVVVKLGTSRLKRIEELAEMLADAEIKPVGFAVIGVSPPPRGRRTPTTAMTVVE